MSKEVSATGNNALEEKVARVRGTKLPQHVAALAVCLGSVAGGAVLGWTANISEDLERGEYNDIPIDDTSLGWIGSLVTLGAMLVCFPTGIMCDKLGRKPTMLLLTIPFMVGWSCIIFANSVEMLYLGRFLTGIAAGAFCISAPMYTNEIAEKEIRGTLGTYFELLQMAGILFAYIMALVVVPKVYTIIVAMIPLMFAAAFLFQPETPVYRMKQGNEDEAKKILVRLRGEAYDTEAELAEIRAMLDEEANNQIFFKRALKKKSTKKAALVCFSLMFFQQAGGITAVVFYTSSILASAGSELDAKVATIFVGATLFFSTFVQTMVIDRFGRRILLVASGLFMAISGTVLGIFFTLESRELVDEAALAALGFIPVLALSTFIVAFGLGYGSIPWVLCAELFPVEIKSTAAAAVGTFNRFCAFLITKFYLDLKNVVGGDGAFYIFSAISFVGTVFVIFVVPETKGKSLEQIQRELNREKVEDEETNSREDSK